MLMHLLIPTNTNDQALDLMDDMDTYVLDLPDQEAIADSLDEAILDSYRQIWS